MLNIDVDESDLITMTAQRFRWRIDEAMKPLHAQLAEANQRIQTLTSEGVAAGHTYDELRDSIEQHLGIPHNSSIYEAIEAMRKENAAKDDIIASLRRQYEDVSAKLDSALARIAELEAVPVVTVPTVPDVQPNLPSGDAPKLRSVAGIIIVKDDTPSPRQDATTRALLDLCGKVGFTAWRGLLNYEEAKAQHDEAEDDPDNLPGYGRRAGMQFVADTVDSQVKRLNDASLVQYFGWLKKLGAAALFFNDVDDPAKAAVIHDWIKRARAAMKEADFHVPLIGSFTANFDRAQYPGFDAYEVQCFGTLSEFKRFMELDAEYLCIDGQKSATLEYLQKMTALVAESGRDFWCYTCKDKETDWRNMPATVEVYASFLRQWKQKLPR